MDELKYRLCGELRVQIGAGFTAHEEEGGGEMIEHHETLRNDLSSVRHAREQLRILLETNDSDMRDMATLLTSEVVTNALIHTTGVVTLSIQCKPGWVRIEVSDESNKEPQHKKVELTSTGGRGIELVDTISKDWGVNSHHDGKTVWFELESEAVETEREFQEDSMKVTFENANTSMVCKTIEHTDQMLHELLVLSKDNENVQLFALKNEVNLSEVAEKSLEQLALGHKTATISVEMPHLAADMALAMLTVLEEADIKATKGELLNPPADKEIKECRNWILNSIAKQLTTIIPTPRPVTEVTVTELTEENFKNEEGSNFNKIKANLA